MGKQEPRLLPVRGSGTLRFLWEWQNKLLRHVRTPPYISVLLVYKPQYAARNKEILTEIMSLKASTVADAAIKLLVVVVEPLYG